MSFSMERKHVKSAVVLQEVSSHDEECWENKWILYMFRLSLVYSFPGKNGAKLFDHLYRVVSASITILQVIVLMSIMYAIGIPKTVLHLGMIIMNGFDLLMRYHLCRQGISIHTILNHITATRYRYRKRSNWKFIIWGLSSVVMISILYIVSVMAVLRITTYYDSSMILFGFKLQSATLTNLIYQAQTFLIIVALYLPIISFSIFYVHACIHLHQSLLSFKAYLTSVTVPAYSHLLQRFLALRREISIIDNNLSTLVFCSILMNVGGLFFTYHAIFKDDPFQDYTQRLTVYIRALNNFMSFLAICTAASKISSVATEIAEEARHLPEDPSASDLSHIRFLMATENKATMTVLGGIPINNTFSLVCLGTLVTYIALLDNIRS